MLLLTLSVPFVWIFSISMVLATAPAFPYADQAVFSLVFGAALAVCALAAARCGVRTGGVARRLDVLAAVGLAACAVALPLGAQMSWVARAAVLAVAAVAYARLVLRCFRLTSGVGERDAVAAVLIPFALAALVRLGLMYAPAMLSVGLLAVSGPLAFWGVAALGPRLGGEGVPTRVVIAPPRPLLPLFIVELCLCALVLGVFKGGVGLAWGVAESTFNYIARALVALVLLAVFSRYGSKGSSGAVRGIISVVLLGLLAISLLGGEEVNGWVSRALFSLSRNFALVVVYLSALDLVRRGWDPDTALGALRGLFELVQGMGIVLAGSLGIAEVPFLFTPEATFLVTAFVGVAVFDQLYQLLSAHPVAPRPVALQDAAPAGIAADELAERCAYLGWLNRLTAREVEVVRLSCEGMSKAEMADRLGLSINTVRWHSQNAYAKLDVHGVDDLRERLGDIEVPADFKSVEPFLDSAAR